MSLQQRTLPTTGLTMVCLAVALYPISDFFLLATMGAMEQRDAAHIGLQHLAADDGHTRR